MPRTDTSPVDRALRVPSGYSTTRRNSSSISTAKASSRETGVMTCTRCRKELEQTAQYLLEHETMDAEAFAKVFKAPQEELPAESPAEE